MEPGFPWGNVFALRCGYLCDAAPLDCASGSRRSKLRHRRFRHGCPHFRSQAFACPGRRRVERAVSPVSFGRSRPGAPLPTAFSASRMRTTLGPSRTSCCLHRTVSTSDILVVTRRHARPTSSSTDALTVTRSSRMVPPMLTFEPRTPHHPAGKGKMGRKPENAFRRLESPRAETHEPNARELLIAYVHPRTASPSLCSCPASDRASSFLLASALLVPPPSLATRRWARREMRPTDFCHPYVNCVHPHPVRSRVTPPLSQRGRLADFGIRAA
jgi:hypothetical protein